MENLLSIGLLKLVPVTVLYLVLGYLVIKVMDFVLGLLKTWKNGNYKSSKMRDGIVRWVAELVAIVFVMLIDLVLGLKFYLCSFTLALFIYKEIGSILENLGECGVVLPKAVTDRLEVFNVDKTGKLPIDIDKKEDVE